MGTNFDNLDRVTVNDLDDDAREVYAREMLSLRLTEPAEANRMALRAAALDLGMRIGQCKARRGPARKVLPPGASEALSMARDEACRVVGLPRPMLDQHSCSFGLGTRTKVASARAWVVVALSTAFGARPTGELLGCTDNWVRAQSCRLGKQASGLHDSATAYALTLRARFPR